jgi:CheY-like chemotaxis protein
MPRDPAGGPAIVCLDDQDNMLRLLRTLLAAGGMRNVETFADAGDALRHLEAWPCDVAICDLQMKPLDGLGFTRRLRAHDSARLQALPVILLTGHAEPERVRAARDAGVDDVLVKPISVGELQARISRVLSRRRAAVD